MDAPRSEMEAFYTELCSISYLMNMKVCLLISPFFFSVGIIVGGDKRDNGIVVYIPK